MEENLRVSGPNSFPSSVEEGLVYSPRGQPNLASYGLFRLPLLLQHLLPTKKPLLICELVTC